MTPPLVIVGSGLAGYGLLRAVRHLDRRRPVVLITADDGAAYLKSQLAGSLARGKRAGELILATPEQMAHRLDASVRIHDRVLVIDRARRRLVTARGEQPYTQLALALGACPLRPAQVRGPAAAQVRTLGSLADYRELRSELEGRRRVAVLGGGRLACEVAESLARSGCAATLLEPSRRLFDGRLPALTAARLAHRIAAVGVRVRLNDGVQRLAAHPSGGCELVTLSGAHLGVDLVLACLGTRPRSGLAREAGLPVRHGIVVDARLRTADPAIFALGECAELDGRSFELPEDIDAAAQVLASVLAGHGARMRWRARMQRVPLEACPLVWCEPPPVSGEWEERATPRGVRALFRDLRGNLRGFALIGDAAAEATRLYGALLA